MKKSAQRRTELRIDDCVIEDWPGRGDSRASIVHDPIDKDSIGLEVG